MRMYLSHAHTNLHKWVMIYHTQPDSEEVELVEDLLFDEEKYAWNYFHATYKVHHFIQPEVVKIHLVSARLSRQE